MVYVLRGLGDGSFGKARSFLTGALQVALQVGDFNGDGRPDLATLSDLSRCVSVLHNLGTFASVGPTTVKRSFDVDHRTVSFSFDVPIAADSVISSKNF